MKYFLFVSTFFSIMLLTVHMVLLPATSSAQNDTCPSGAPKQYSDIKPGTVVNTYFLSWHGRKYTPNNFEKVAQNVTHLTYAFARPNRDGSCDFLHPKIALGIGEEYAAEGGNFDQLIKVKERHPHLKVLLSVGGGGCDQTFVHLAKSKLLEVYAQACIKILDSYTYVFEEGTPDFGKTKLFKYEKLFDGIDINWEFSPTGVKKEIADAYLMFVQIMRRLLDKRERRLRKTMLLTATLQVSPKVYGDLPIDQVAESIDWFNVMGYDIYNASAQAIGHNAPICGSYNVYTIDGALNRIMNRGVSPDKLVLILPGYGHQYGETAGFNKPFNRKSKHTRSLPYKDIVKIERDYQLSWDTRARVPVLSHRQNKIAISYDDENSFKQKIGLASLKLLLGVGLWAISYVYDNVQDRHYLIDIMSELVGEPFIF